MNKKLMMTASSLAHIASFHLPYIKAFHDMGWEVHVAGAGPDGDIPFANEVFCTHFEKRFFSVANFKAALFIRRKLRLNGYDLIICHTSLAAFFTRLASVGIKRDSKIINVVHGYLFDGETPFLKAAVLKMAEHLMASQTDLLLTMNEWDRDWAAKHKVASRLASIPGMGVDKNKFMETSRDNNLSLNEDDFVLVYPAEFSKRKNQAMLIRAMNMLPESVKLVLPGEGSLLDDCRHLARSMGLEQRVIFPGHVSNVLSILNRAHAAVSASRSEGLPFNILEGMMSSLPVVASDVKGNADLVQNGVNGFLYPYDDEAAFATCIEKLIQNESMRRNVGLAGRQMVEQYTLDMVLPKVMKEYLSLA